MLKSNPKLVMGILRNIDPLSACLMRTDSSEPLVGCPFKFQMYIFQTIDSKLVQCRTKKYIHNQIWLRTIGAWNLYSKIIH